MLAARGSAASFSATGLGSQRQLDLAAAGAWGFLGNQLLGPFPCNDFSEAAGLKHPQCCLSRICRALEFRMRLQACCKPWWWWRGVGAAVGILAAPSSCPWLPVSEIWQRPPVSPAGSLLWPSELQGIRPVFWTDSQRSATWGEEGSVLHRREGGGAGLGRN